LHLLHESNNRLNDAMRLVLDNCPEPEFIAFRKEVGQIMGSVFFDLMRPIHRAHPELEPEQIKAAIEQGRQDRANAK
jgi:hypothetical protein